MSRKVDVHKLTPLLLYEFKMFIPARVNGKQTLATLDTGATQVSVSPQLAEGLPRTGKIKVQSAFGEKESDTVDIEIEFLDRAPQRREARVYSDQDIEGRPFLSMLILDGNALFAQPIVFDFRMMAIVPLEEKQSNEWKQVVAEFTEHGLCLVQFTSKTEKPICALFDTGAGLTALNKKRVDDLGIMLQDGYEIEIGDATGAKSLQQVSAASGIRVGDLSLPLFDCFTVDLSGIEERIGRRVDMVLGANAMMKSGWRWWFDKQDGKVWVSV